MSQRPDLAFDPPSAFDEPKLREECGVFGVLGVDDAARKVALGLHALQHRGQEGCGIATFDGRHFHNRCRAGLVGENFSGGNLNEELPGRAAIGHVRYSTTGRPAARNLQPLYADYALGGMAVAHNGNLVNGLTLRKRLVERGQIFHSDTDSEALLHLVAISRARTVQERFLEAIDELQGGYAMVALANDMLLAARDPHGIRPLVLGRLGAGFVVASETTALKLVGATYKRDIEPGEVVMITNEGLEAIRRPIPRRRPRTCAFEYIYFARPDSKIDGISVHAARRAMGMILAEEAPAPNADVVVAVPDSGVPAAIGYAAASGIPYDLGIIRSHHVGRTFIQPGQGERDMKVLLKHRANEEVLKDKEVVLVDDSIVRGTTSEKIVRMVEAAGAKRIHFRSACPPITHPDFYGIDTPRREELLAHRIAGDAARAERLGAHSLAFLSVDGLYRAILGEPRNPDDPQLTDHYFTGAYPTRLVDLENGLLQDPHSGSLLEPSPL